MVNVTGDYTIMIELLKDIDIDEAARVYNKGLAMEIPQGRNRLSTTIKRLKEIDSFIYKEDGRIKGLLSFTFRRTGDIQLDFICAMEVRRGIGRKLMRTLVDFASSRGISMIYSNVSEKDSRAMKFYERLGFIKYGSYHVSKHYKIYRIKIKASEMRF